MIQQAAFSHFCLIILKLAYNNSYKTNAGKLIFTPSHNKCEKSVQTFHKKGWLLINITSKLLEKKNIQVKYHEN